MTADAAQRAGLVPERLAVLPWAERHAVHLRLVEGKPLREAARALGVAESELQGLVWSALRRLWDEPAAPRTS